MQVADEHVSMLRTYLSASTDAAYDEAVRMLSALTDAGCLDGIAELVYGTFAAATRRRFSPTWTSADIVRFVADFRRSSSEAASLISPSSAENQLRGVLGDAPAARPPAEADARAQLLLLAALSASMDEDGLDAALAEGRLLADRLLN